jgi:GTP-binding protein Era
VPKDASPETRAGRVALVGRPNVGKSTLLNAIVGEHLSAVSHHPQTTRDRITGIVTERRLQLAVVDTPGLKAPRTRLEARMLREARAAMGGADVLVFVTDLRPPAQGPLAVDKGDIALLESLPPLPLLLVVNKVDRVKDKGRLLPLLEAYGKLRSFAAIVPLSAKMEKPRRLVAALRELLPFGDKAYDDEELTDRSVRFLTTEIVREEILKKTRAEVPHGVAVVVEGWDEAGKVVRIDLAIVVDKPTHKKILIGKAGSVLKAIGMAARERVEQLVGQKVHLATWVRVSPRWYESDAKLVELGYPDSGDAP